MVGVLLTLAGAARAEVFAALEAAPQRVEDWPFQTATLALRVSDAWASEVACVVLREAGGGPALRVPVALPPGVEQRITVALPAWAIQQAYAIELRGDPSGRRLLGGASAEILWAADRLASARIIDADTAGAWEADLPVWPLDMRANLILAGALMVLASAGAMLARRNGLRGAILLAVLAGGGVAGGCVLTQAPAVVRRDLAMPVSDADGRMALARLTVLTTRRTVAWQTDEPLWPVYGDRRELANDTMTIEVGGVRRLTLKPSQVRLLVRMEP